MFAIKIIWLKIKVMVGQFKALDIETFKNQIKNIFLSCSPHTVTKGTYNNIKKSPENL